MDLHLKYCVLPTTVGTVFKTTEVLGILFVLKCSFNCIIYHNVPALSVPLSPLCAEKMNQVSQHFSIHISVFVIVEIFNESMTTVRVSPPLIGTGHCVDTPVHLHR